MVRFSTQNINMSVARIAAQTIMAMQAKLTCSLDWKYSIDQKAYSTLDSAANLIMKKCFFTWRHLNSDAHFGLILDLISTWIGSHKPTHVIYASRVKFYTSGHRSPSEHLISSNDEFCMANPVASTWNLSLRNFLKCDCLYCDTWLLFAVADSSDELAWPWGQSCSKTRFRHR